MMSEEKINLSNEFDAMVWVKEWMRITKENPSIPTDEDTMLGWFANAIMAGYDTAKREDKALPKYKFISGDYDNQGGTIPSVEREE
jgi:hypothetical protein